MTKDSDYLINTDGSNLQN